MTAVLYGAPDVVWYEPGAISVATSGLIALTTGASVLFAILDDGAPARNNVQEKGANFDTMERKAASEDREQASSMRSNSVSGRARLVFLKKLNVHPEKCRAVQFSPEKLPSRERVALLLEPSTVKVIDYPTMEVIWNEEFPSTAPIKAIRFLNDRPQCLALGFASADLIVVNLANKKVQKSGRLLVKNVQEELQDMDVSNGQAVLGCSKGTAAVVDLHTWKVLVKCKVSGQIRAVKWNPTGDVAAVMAVGEKGPLFISDTSQQANSYIVPLCGKATRVPYTDKALQSVSVCWIEDKIVVSVPSGTLCFGKFKGKNTKLEPIHQELLSKSICALCPVAPNIVLTSGIDRVLALWDLTAERQTLLRCHAGLAGFVYNMAFHPAGTGVLGIATGNGSVLLAKTDQGTLEQVGKHLQLRSRVYSIAWHPTNEMQLAVGTQDGEVLVFDVSPHKTNVSRFRTNKRVGVGSIVFASLPLVSEWPLLLATDGTHAYFSKEKEEVLRKFNSMVPGIENHKIGCVSHVPQKNLILFGTYQGKLIALDSSSLRIAAETRIEKHAVTGLAVSPCGKKVAAVFSTSYFTLFDTDQLCSRFGDGQPSQPVEPKYRITDHSCTAFCWNPYDENVFAIGGNKGEVKLWNLRSGSLQRVFHGVAGNKTILAMCWSPIAENRVYLGTNGNTLYQLDMDECEDKESTNCSTEVDLIAHKIASTRSGSAKSSKKASLFSSSSNSENIPKAEALEDLLVLLSCEENGNFSPLKNKPHMGFFHTDLIQNTLTNEAEQHCVKMNNDLALQVLLTGGNIRETVEFAKERKQLDQKLVTLSVFVSKEYFDETVSALIDQNKESDILSVLPLMVATGRTEELLQLLCARNFHKEAAAVGLTTLTRDHPAVKNVYTSWASRYIEAAQYERAARCYLAAEEKEKVVDVLTLYHDAGSASTAAICAKRFGLPSELLLLKAVRNLLASVESLPWLSRLAEEFKVTALDGLSTLAQAVRSFYQNTKPSEELSGEPFLVPVESLDKLIKPCLPLFTQDDLEFVNKLLEGVPLIRTTDELQVSSIYYHLLILMRRGLVSRPTNCLLKYETKPPVNFR
ncbi:uncharacterized protein LOC111253399 isoform X2 [Varroa destructor]|uniref:Gem-associated protein 5 TPR domain-containing protein n=1 Tax=Varroa destructor TaxID=109461 RepID=A0A7M7KNF8_VARDE|nr:uncharacterized protein LOC111253399 isoform X2 [Varroa destructor]